MLRCAMNSFISIITILQSLIYWALKPKYSFASGFTSFTFSLSSFVVGFMTMSVWSPRQPYLAWKRDRLPLPVCLMERDRVRPDKYCKLMPIHRVPTCMYL